MPHKAGPRLGLLVIGHGSAGQKWNAAFQRFGEQVARLSQTSGRFAATCTAFLESASPTIADGIKQLEAERCDAVVAVPVFVTVGRHTLFDVPAALGIFYSRNAADYLAEHAIVPAVPRIPVIYTSCLDEGDLLERYAVAEITRYSPQGEDPGVVFLIHGSSDCRVLLERRMEQLLEFCRQRAGASYADYAVIGVSRGFERHGIAAIRKAAEICPHVIVIALYVATTAQSIANRLADEHPELLEGLPHRGVVFSQATLLDFPETAAHVLALAETAAKLRKA
jgi:sirohydrochlorin ferrochelatase